MCQELLEAQSLASVSKERLLSSQRKQKIRTCKSEVSDAAIGSLLLGIRRNTKHSNMIGKKKETPSNSSALWF